MRRRIEAIVILELTTEVGFGDSWEGGLEVILKRSEVRERIAGERSKDTRGLDRSNLYHLGTVDRDWHSQF